MTDETKMPSCSKRYLRLRVAVYVEKDDRVLLILDPVYRGGCWTIPGGTVDFGETFIQAAEREVFEETSLTIRVRNLWRMRELWEMDPDSLDAPQPIRRSFEFILLGEYISGSVNIDKDPDLIAPDGLRHVTDCQWVPLCNLGSSIGDLPLYPPELFTARHRGKLTGIPLDALMLSPFRMS